MPEKAVLAYDREENIVFISFAAPVELKPQVWKTEKAADERVTSSPSSIRLD